MRPTNAAQTILKLVVFLFVPFTAANGFQQPELLIPAKTKVSLQLLSPVSTATSKKDDKFNCKVLTPVEFAGAVVEGHVRSVKRSGKADKASKLDLAFDRVTLTDGRTANFSATIIEVFDVVNAKDQGLADNEGTIRNKSTAVKTSIKRAAVGALIGAIVGGAVAGGQGAVIGAAIGAGVGATTTLATRGPDLELKTGTEFTVVTDGPSRVKDAKAARLTPLPERVESPSAESRVYLHRVFRVGIPLNWKELAQNPLMLGPAGAVRMNNGQPELTHGLMMGVAQPATGNLKEISDRFIETLIRNNPGMRKEGNSTASTIGGVNALAAVLTGPGTAGKVEVVTVHTVLLPGSRFFYTITVAPEAEIDVYREAFNKVVASIEFVN
jgi:outer membrane lipoprotein SlyB